VWLGDDAVDPLEQAQTLQILVGAGIKTRKKARADLGLAPAGGTPGKAPTKLGKYNPHHDERGLFATADNAAGPVGSPARKPRPTGVQVTSNERVESNASRARTGVQVAQIETPFAEPAKPFESAHPAETAPTATVADAVAPNGGLPGVADKLGAPVQCLHPTIPIRRHAPLSSRPTMEDGAYITFRPAAQASSKALASTASVGINDAKLKQLNAANFLN
jgi:hypothetical protein